MGTGRRGRHALVERLQVVRSNTPFPDANFHAAEHPQRVAIVLQPLGWVFLDIHVRVEGAETANGIGGEVDAHRAEFSLPGYEFLPCLGLQERCGTRHIDGAHLSVRV